MDLVAGGELAALVDCSEAGLRVGRVDAALLRPALATSEASISVPALSTPRRVHLTAELDHASLDQLVRHKRLSEAPDGRVVGMRSSVSPQTRRKFSRSDSALSSPGSDSPCPLCSSSALNIKSGR